MDSHSNPSGSTSSASSSPNPSASSSPPIPASTSGTTTNANSNGTSSSSNQTNGNTNTSSSTSTDELNGQGQGQNQNNGNGNGDASANGHGDEHTGEEGQKRSDDPKSDVESKNADLELLGDLSNLIINYIPISMSEEELRVLFAPYGEIERVKIVNDKFSGFSLGYGFVKFSTATSANAAIAALNGHQIGNKRLKVSVSKPPALEKKTNLYISGLPSSWTQTELEHLVGRFGSLMEARVLYDLQTRKCKGVGFARFHSQKAALAAINTLTGTTVDGGIMPLIVKYADTSSDKMRKAMQAGFQPTHLQQQHQHQQQQQMQQQIQQHALQHHQHTVPQAQHGHAGGGGGGGNGVVGGGGGGGIHSHPHSSTSAASTPASHHPHHPLQSSSQPQVPSPYQPSRYLSPSPPNALTSAGTSPYYPSLPTSYYPPPPSTAGGNGHYGGGNAGAAAAAAAVGQYGLNNPHAQLSPGALGSSGNHHSTSSHLSSSHPASSANGFPSSSSSSSHAPSSSGGAHEFTGICLFVYHLPLEATESTLYQLFGNYGVVSSAKVMRDLLTGRSKGFGFVNLMNEQQAQSAIQGLNGFQLGSKYLKVALKQ